MDSEWKLKTLEGDEGVERALVATLMHAPNRMADLIRIGVEVEWFQDILCRKVWESMVLLHNKAGTFDYCLIREASRSTIKDEYALALSILHDLDRLAGTNPAFLMHYAKVLKRRKKERETSSVLQDMAHGQKNPVTAEDYADFLSAGAGEISEIAAGMIQDGELDPAAQIRAASKEVRSSPGGIVGIRTGLIELDRIVGGLRPGELIYIGAGTGIGKSAFAVTVAANVLQRDPEAVVFYASAEMRDAEIIKRMISATCGVNIKSIEQGTATADQIRQWDETTAMMCVNPPTVLHHGMKSGDQIAAAATSLKCRKRRLDLIIVDHIHSMQGKAENRTNEITKISARIQSIAHELEVPVLACAQINREGSKNSDRQPVLTDLRDSGSVEQDGDMVIFIHRPGAKDPHNIEKRSHTEIIIAKNRRGETGMVYALFQEQFTRFVNAESGYGAPTWKSQP